MSWYGGTAYVDATVLFVWVLVVPRIVRHPNNPGLLLKSKLCE